MRDVSFRKATRGDAEYIASRLRADDVREVLALGVPPEQALLISFLGSDEVWTASVDGEPAMMFGCRQGLLDDAAEVWALGTSLCTECPREMLVYGRQRVRDLLTRFPRMRNFCDARYKASHRWLRRLGFTVGSPTVFGPQKKMFCQIFIGGD